MSGACKSSSSGSLASLGPDAAAGCASRAADGRSRPRSARAQYEEAVATLHEGLERLEGELTRERNAAYQVQKELEQGLTH